MVGWAGRLTPIKRPLDLIRTLRSLRDRDVDAVLVILGDGDERLETEALARELGVFDATRFLGFRQGLRAWYPALDAFLLTSANEGAPVVAIEALAAERPVVATDVGGTATVVTDGETGFLVPMGDIDGLAARLTELARDPELRARFGHTGSGGCPRALRDGPNGRRASKRSTAAFSPVEGPARPQAHRRERIREPPARTASRRSGLRGVDARFLGLDVPGSNASRFYERLERLGVPYERRPLRPGRQPADGQGRRCGRSGSSGPTSSTPTSCMRTFTARSPPRPRASATSRPATTTTATCSAPFGMSTAHSRAGRAG